MRNLNVAILMGGDSEEWVISLKTAAVIQKHLDGPKMLTRLIDNTGADWKDALTGAQIK